MKSLTLDDVQTELWSLYSDIEEDKIPPSEIKRRVHESVEILEEIIKYNNLWDKSL